MSDLFEGKDHKDVYVKENNVFVCLDGSPTALKRHRSRLMGSRIIQYDSQKDLKQQVLKRVLMQLPAGFQPFECPIEFLIEFHMPIPKSTSRVRRARMSCAPHFISPDLSNMIKFIEDVFNGILYKDDKQIAKIKATKVHSNDPKTVLCIREYVEEDSYIESLKKGRILQ